MVLRQYLTSVRGSTTFLLAVCVLLHPGHSGLAAQNRTVVSLSKVLPEQVVPKDKIVEVEVPWAKVPAAVQRTLKENSGGKPVGVVTRKVDVNERFYEGRVFKGDESRLAIKVAEDGKLINIKTLPGYPGEEWAKDTKIGIADARARALKLQPGQLIDEALERESGGSGLRYSFDIKVNRIVHTVDIDAVTGKILENSVEGRSD